jgi:hypothetical protein
MNILFRGGNFSNKGDEAMMLTVQKELTKRLPSVNFFLRTSERAREKAYSHGLFASTSSGGPVRRAFRLARACIVNKDLRRASRIDRVAAETVDLTIQMNGA